MAPETSQTLDRGLLILDVLARHPQGLSVTDLGRELGVSRTVVYRLVVTLEGHGFLRRARDGRCRLGMKPLSLVRQINPVIREAALPVMRRLSEQMVAGTQFSVLDGNEAIVIAAVEPPRPEMSAGGVRVVGRPVVDRTSLSRAAVATRPLLKQPDPGWIVSGSGAQSNFMVTTPIVGVPGLNATLSLASAFEIEESQVGPRIVQAAAEIARALR